MLNTYYEPVDNPEKIILNNNLYLGIVKPEESINLIYNPEVVSLDGYTFVPQVSSTGSIELSVEDQFVGINSIKAEMYLNDRIEIDINNTLIQNQPYTFSFYSKNDSKFNVYFVNQGGLIISSRIAYKSEAFWKRNELTFVPTANYENAKIVIECISLGTTVYLDAFQLEPKAYSTMFISGNLEGSQFETVKPYFWIGAPNASPSVRRNSTNTGGRIVDIVELGFDIIGIQDLGLPNYNHIIQELAINNYNYYSGSTIDNRKMSILLSITAENQKDYLIKKNKLNNLITNNNGVKLIIGFKENNIIQSDLYQIDAVYEKGLEGNIGNLISETFSVEFTLLNKHLVSLKNTTVELNTYKKIDFTHFSSTINNPIFTNSNLTNEWEEIAANNNAIRVINVNKIITAQNNNVYIIGNILDVSSSKNYLMAEWNGKTLTPLLEIVTGVGAYDAVLTNDNRIYIVGDFQEIYHSAALIANNTLSRLSIIRYNLYDNLVYKVFETNGAINCIDSKNGEIAIGGTFTQLGDEFEVVNINYLAKYNINNDEISQLHTSAFSLGVGEYISTIKYGKDSKIWFGGNFSYSGVDKNILYIDKESTSTVALIYNIDGVTFNYSLTFDPNVLNPIDATQTMVNCIEITDKNEVYIGGVFNSTNSLEAIPFVDQLAGNINIPFSIAKWNGSTWDSMQLLAHNLDETHNTAIVYDIKYNKDTNNLFVVGDFRYAGKRYMGQYNQYISPVSYSHENNCNGIAIWTGSTWLPYPFELVNNNNRSDLAIRGVVKTLEFIGLNNNPYHSDVLYNQFSGDIQTSDFGITATQPNSLIFTLEMNSLTALSPKSVGAYFAEITQVDTKCSNQTKPIINLIGPGKLKWLRNNNGTYIHFNSYDIKEFDEVTLNLNKLVPYIKSNIEGDIRHVINVTSSLNSFKLDPGLNTIELFIFPDANNADAYMTFKTHLLSIEQIYNINEI